MKKVLTSFLLVAFVGLMYAQPLPIDPKTNKVTFIKKVEAPGMSISDLEKVVKDFMKDKPYTLKEEEAGKKLVYTAFLAVSHPAKGGGYEDGKVHFTFSVFFKEGRYRIILTDYIHEGNGKVPDGGKLEAKSAACGPIKMTASAWVKIKNRTKQLSEKSIADLKQKILETQNDPANDDDW